MAAWPPIAACCSSRDAGLRYALLSAVAQSLAVKCSSRRSVHAWPRNAAAFNSRATGCAAGGKNANISLDSKPADHGRPGVGMAHLIQEQAALQLSTVASTPPPCLDFAPAPPRSRAAAAPAAGSRCRGSPHMPLAAAETCSAKAKGQEARRGPSLVPCPPCPAARALTLGLPAAHAGAGSAHAPRLEWAPPPPPHPPHLSLQGLGR